MKTDNLFKTLISNTIVIFIFIVILMLIITYLSFKRIETYKFLIVINVIASIIIFILLSANDHFKNTSGFDLIQENKTIGGNLDENKIKYFNSIFDGGLPISNDEIKGTTLNDDIDQQIEKIIKEIQ